VSDSSISRHFWTANDSKIVQGIAQWQNIRKSYMIYQTVPFLNDCE